MENNRIEYVDVAKGMLICLMVWGHILNVATYQPEANEFVKDANMLETLYKGFYMCAFLVITGYCSNFDKSFVVFTKANLRTIVLPAFSMFYITQAINLWYANDGEIMDFLKFDFYRFFVNQGLSAWFLASLFVARNLYWCIIRIVNNNRYRFVLFLALYVLGYYLSHHTQNYWSYQQGLMFLFFLEYGQYLRNCLGGQNNFSMRKFALCLLVYIMLYVYTEYITDFSIIGIHRTISLTKTTLLSNLLLAVCGSYMCLFLSMKIQKNSILQYFGRNSLIVYLLNWHIIVIFWDIFHPLLGEDNVTNIVCYIAILLLTMAFSAVMINMLNLRYLRCLIGKK